ncbi:hypothetical protein [Dactylosporangium sp. NPDC049140]|uniref:hypothetical protein n=1 Tax=Dactylosporangium sp. NPDC049140 TaxID=3155647 RepID=UPI0034014CB1
MVGVDDETGGSAEQQFYDVAGRWATDQRYGPVELINAACRALVDGLDSPSLRELAGASVDESFHDLRQLLGAALDELHLPEPGTVLTGYTVGAGGLLPRPATDTLRLKVTSTPVEASVGFQVQVYVNDVEVTSAGAGLGMDPYDLLVPTNRLIAVNEPRTVPIARCKCGEYGCGSTDVTLVRDGERVHWDWSKEVPMCRGVSFAADVYDAEVARLAADHSWETPDRAAGRLIMARLDGERLQSAGLQVSWVANYHRNPELFRIALQIDDAYQVFVDTPWRGRSAEDLAHEVCQTLDGPPYGWRASWHAIKRGVPEPPAIAGPSWHRYRP